MSITDQAIANIAKASNGTPLKLSELSMALSIEKDRLARVAAANEAAKYATPEELRRVKGLRQTRAARRANQVRRAAK